MELKLSQGKYVSGETGALEHVSGEEEIVQRVLCRLSARRGGFYPMPDFGSRLHSLSSFKPSARVAAARQFVHEALEKETGVEIISVDCEEAENGSFSIALELSIDGSGRELTFTV